MYALEDISNSGSCYFLNLSNGVTWQLVGLSSIQPWLSRFAKIMDLKACQPLENVKSIYFFDKAENKEAYEVLKKVDPLISPMGMDAPIPEHAVRENFRLRFREKGNNTLCELDHKNANGVQIIVDMWTALMPIYSDSMQIGGIPFHAAVAELEGKAIIIAAPGSTGKSTSSRRLPDYWRSMCDDESLVIVDKNGHYRVHPFPTWSEYLWSKSSKVWDVQSSAQLSAIFCLEQSDIDKVTLLGEGEAAIMINESVNQTFRKFTWTTLEDEDNHNNYRRLIFKNSCKMAKTIPTFKLQATLTGKFWEEIEKVI